MNIKIYNVVQYVITRNLEKKKRDLMLGISLIWDLIMEVGRLETDRDNFFLFLFNFNRREKISCDKVHNK